MFMGGVLLSYTDDASMKLLLGALVLLLLFIEVISRNRPSSKYKEPTWMSDRKQILLFRLLLFFKLAFTG